MKDKIKRRVDFLFRVISITDVPLHWNQSCSANRTSEFTIKQIVEEV